MPSNQEMSYFNKATLYEFLRIKKRPKYIDEAINKQIAVMEAEDVAVVEKQISSLPDEEK